MSPIALLMLVICAHELVFATVDPIRVRMVLTPGVYEKHRLAVPLRDQHHLKSVVIRRFRSISAGLVTLDDIELTSPSLREPCWTVRFKDVFHGTGLADRLLQRVAPLFERHGIRYLLNYGSLLGAVRQNGWRGFMHYDFKVVTHMCVPLQLKLHRQDNN